MKAHVFGGMKSVKVKWRRYSFFPAWVLDYRYHRGPFSNYRLLFEAIEFPV